MKLNWQQGIIKKVAVLVSGTIFAQIIHYITLPYITRLYSPSHFAEYARFLTISSILGSAASLRYEIQIPIARAQKLALYLLVIAILSSTAVSLAFSIVLIGLMEFGDSAIPIYFALVPLSLIMAGMQSSLGYWALRHKDYRWISRTGASRAAIGAGIQVLSGIVNPNSLGLGFGLIAKNSLGFIAYGWKTYSQCLELLRRLRWSRLMKVAMVYRSQPLFSTLETLANTTAANVPVLIGILFSLGDEVGQMMLAIQVLQAPASLIGTAVSQVYLSEGGDRLKNGTLSGHTVWIVEKILMISAPPLVIAIGFWSKELFSIIFGGQWGGAATDAKFLVPSILFQLMASPVSAALDITHNQRLAFILQLGGLAFRAGLMVLGILLIGTHAAFGAYSIANTIFYATYLAVILFSIGAKGAFKRILLRYIIIVLAAAAFGYTSRLITGVFFKL